MARLSFRTFLHLRPVFCDVMYPSVVMPDSWADVIHLNEAGFQAFNSSLSAELFRKALPFSRIQREILSPLRPT
jgi:hypothetical protein